MSLEIIKMEIIKYGGHLFYVSIAGIDVIAALVVAIGLVWGKGEPRKKLLHSVLMLVGAAVFCFGSQAVLELFDMGWRCTPFNVMMFLCLALFAVMLFRCMNVFRDDHGRVVWPVRIVLGVILLMKLMVVYIGFHLGGWYDNLVPYNGEMIVCASNSHGGSGAGYFFAHINSLIHGAEIPPEVSASWGWWGPR